MTAEALLSRLEKVKTTGQGRWIACCPAHAGAGRENLVRIGAAAPLAIQAHFLRLQPLWRAALGSRTAGRFLFPVLTPTSSATIFSSGGVQFRWGPRMITNPCFFAQSCAPCVGFSVRDIQTKSPAGDNRRAFVCLSIAHYQATQDNRVEL